MSRILPDPLVGQVTPGVLRVYRALRAIPGDEFTVWVGLPLPGMTARPEFLVVHEGRTAFLLTVSSISQNQAEEAIHGGLFSTTEVNSLAAAERDLVRSFIQQATGTSVENHPPAVFGFVLFPEVEHETLTTAFPKNPHEGLYYLGQEHLKPETLADVLRQLVSEDSAGIDAIRSRYSPESIVPIQFSPRRKLSRNLDATLTHNLLDYDQEAWVKHRLRLSGDAAVVAEEAPPFGDASLVTGVAGSGKSLVLLFRACTQAQLDPSSRSLILTHNRALRHELEARFGDLGRPSNVDWNTFSAWTWSCLSRVGYHPRMVVYSERDALIEEAARPVWERLSPNRIEFLREEFDWIQDRAIQTLADYLEIERVGRGVSLAKDQRRQVFTAFQSYRSRLEALGGEDWSGLAARFLREIESGKLQLPTYDFIYVDEAQFFAPVWFLCVKYALQPANGRLLLAADPTQGFLKRRASWLACGLDLRGRSTRLRKSYRNSRPILEFARDFYFHRLGNDEAEDLNLPEEGELDSAPSGEFPVLAQLSAQQDEIGRLINEIDSFLEAGGAPEAILVLIAEGRFTAEVASTLRSVFGDSFIADAREPNQAKGIRVIAVDAATGLEAPIVFVIGAARLLATEQDLQLSEPQRLELIRDNTRRLYMAFTRAGVKLIITWVGDLPDWAAKGENQAAGN